MGLSMRLEKGTSYPVLTCDACGKPIQDWRFALVAFPWSSEESIVGVRVFHKVTCDPKVTSQDSEETSNCQHLDGYLSWLLWNHKWGKQTRGKKGARLTIDVPEPLGI